MMNFWIVLLIGGITVVLDQLTKHGVQRHFAYGESYAMTKFFSLTYIHNTGSAFGMFAGNNHALIVVALIILGFLLYSARGLCERAGAWGAWGVGLVLGGAVGNLIDRVQMGKVIDFLDFHFWPVFNLADTAISIGAVCLMIGLWRDRRAFS